MSNGNWEKKEGGGRGGHMPTASVKQDYVHNLQYQNFLMACRYFDVLVFKSRFRSTSWRQNDMLMISFPRLPASNDMSNIFFFWGGGRPWVLSPRKYKLIIIYLALNSLSKINWVCAGSGKKW